VPHVIGAGITLLEPQRVQAGMSGKTLRFWDWDRRYDAAGHPDPGGKPRTLHLEQALTLLKPQELTGEGFLRRVRPLGTLQESLEEATGLRCWTFPPNNYYQSRYFEAESSSQAMIEAPDNYGALIVLKGAM